MATVVLTAVGTALGGPIGGSIGALIGSQIDGALFKPSDREGPRLKELSVTTSSYGTPIARHFGKVRVAGSIIWATDLIESSEKLGGGKGQPSTKTFSYSVSFAVALGSRPIGRIGRIWADGNLLRGAAGDLKVGGQMRFYSGHGDQQPDPLLASAEGAHCPAFRGIAYCVFEALQLAEFGNRIPALTIEAFADDGSVAFPHLLETVDLPIQSDVLLDGLAGYSDEGGPLGRSLELIERLYPFTCQASSIDLLFQNDSHAAPVTLTLPEAVADPGEESFGRASGTVATRHTQTGRIPSGLRYYDVERDYQAGLQRAGGRATPGRNEIIEFPASLDATTARLLADNAAERARWAGDVLHWRVAELNPAIVPGALVRVPQRSGNWQVTAWEWRESGIELELTRQPNTNSLPGATDAGRSLPSQDAIATPTIMRAAELPWDGQGSAHERQVIVAASSAGGGWNGAMLYADNDGSLSAIRASGSRRSVIGNLTQPLPSASPHIVDRESSIQLHLVAEDLVLTPRLLGDLANGDNRAVIGSEIIQFAHAENLGGGLWHLSGLLRGRGGTEAAAAAGHLAGASFILLDDKAILLSGQEVGEAQDLAAIGIADDEPASAEISGTGRTLQPLTPVHPQSFFHPDGSMSVCWTRRARGAWIWAGSVEPALAEQTELYEVGIGNPSQPAMVWPVNTARLDLSAPAFTDLQTNYAGQAIWVRQIGSHDRSAPLHILTIN